MPRKFTAEHRRKLSEAKKGNKNASGKHSVSKAGQMRMRKAHLGKSSWNNTNTFITCEVCGQKKKVKPANGDSRFCSYECYWASLIGGEPWNKDKKCPQLSGENHWNWQNGKTGETRKRINTLEWKRLRAKAYERDNWQCQHCGEHCRDDIQCHHIIPYDISRDDDMENLITLCKACHLKEHARLRSSITS